MLNRLFNKEYKVNQNFLFLTKTHDSENQTHTNKAFSEKWTEYEATTEKEKAYNFQKQWYLTLYGFESERELAKYLNTKTYIFDAGCGLGYKAKWFADLAPKAVVIGMDFSEACKIAAENYRDTKNLFFMQGDIAKLPFKDGSFDYVNCDQVLMHTEIPENTFSELSRITKDNGEFACYVYAKKALPRELLDEHFRNYCKTLSHDELWDMSEKLTQLGKTLSDLNIKIDVPDIPQMDIKGGKYDLQRFLYWNFFKCFWNKDLGWNNSVSTNFDWYSPSNAKRYSKKEFEDMINKNNLITTYFHQEEACLSGRFCKLSEQISR